jgi:hypothetical protein
VRRRPKGSVLFLGLSALLAFATPMLTTTSAQGAPAKNGRLPLFLSNPSFSDSSFQVVPGSTVSLHWTGGIPKAGTSGVHYVVTSSVPNFSSTSVVKWPPKTSPPPKWGGNGWSTTATALTLAVPVKAEPGAQYDVSLTTCDPQACVHTARIAQLTVTPSPTRWSIKSYRSAFHTVSTFATPGQPFATTFLRSNGSIWNASEFSHDAIEIKQDAQAARTLPVASPASAPEVFKKPFAYCSSKGCRKSSDSALSEQVITSDGWIWLTFGGWREWAGESLGSFPPNHSEVVALDPVTKKFCTYLVPGDNNQVAGIAVTGVAPHSYVWFVESRGTTGQASLDGFNPSVVGRTCNGRANRTYVLPQSVRLLTWPSTGGQWPVQIAADPSSPTLWITNYNAFYSDGQADSQIDRVDISNPTNPTLTTAYVYPDANSSSVFGAKPWTIVAPAGSNYVYAMDNGDAQIVRINKVTNQVQEVPIPLTSDLESGFGLAASSGRLYFTLADDSLTNFGTTSTFGYIDLTTWPDGSPPQYGVIYTGLAHKTDPKTRADYRAISASPTGQIAITDHNGMIRLTP